MKTPPFLISTAVLTVATHGEDFSIPWHIVAGGGAYEPTLSDPN